MTSSIASMLSWRADEKQQRENMIDTLRWESDATSTSTSTSYSIMSITAKKTNRIHNTQHRDQCVTWVNTRETSPQNIKQIEMLIKTNHDSSIHAVIIHHSQDRTQYVASIYIIVVLSTIHSHLIPTPSIILPNHPSANTCTETNLWDVVFQHILPL